MEWHGNLSMGVRLSLAAGSGDLRVRSVIPFLKKYIPGNPDVVSEFMDGGGGRKAANHIYSIRNSDGQVIGKLGGGVIANAVLGEAGVSYDLEKCRSSARLIAPRITS